MQDSENGGAPGPKPYTLNPKATTYLRISEVSSSEASKYDQLGVCGLGCREWRNMKPHMQFKA